MDNGNIIGGVDTGKLEEFRKAQKVDPVSLGLEAKALWDGEMGRSTVHIGPYSLNKDRIDRQTRQYTVSYGAWREVEEAVGVVGPTDRMEPVEMALGAMAACIVNAITFNAYRHDISLDDIKVSISVEVNPDVLFELQGPQAHNSCMTNLRAEIKVKGDNLTPEKLETIKKLAEYSPVDGLVAQTNNVTHVVTT